MFQMPVIEVPTNLPNIRKDLPIQAFAVRHLILECFLNSVYIFLILVYYYFLLLFLVCQFF